MNRPLLALLTVSLLIPELLAAQSGPDAFRDEIMGHFRASTSKVAALAEAIPESLYAWRPSEDVASVETVYLHIARYNFLYLEDNLGIPAPSDVDVANLEELSGKAITVEMIDRSIAHVEAAVETMSQADLGESTSLYGRDVEKWAVLLQLVAHMNEHLGQSIAYARANGVAPPWSN